LSLHNQWMPGMPDIAEENKSAAPMTHFVVELVVTLGFSFIVVVVINSANLLPFKLDVPFVCGSVVLIHIWSRIYIRYLKKKAEVSSSGRKTLKGARAIYRVVQGVIGIGVLVSLPFLWWGVIKRLAMVTGKGGSIM
jgi:hypothetical protein